MRLLTAVAVAAAAFLASGSQAAVKPKVPAPTLDRFLFFATFEGLCEDSISDEAAKAALEQDAKGRYVNFVYACPICHPVVEGFRAYLLRSQIYYSRKGEAFLGGGEDDASRGLSGRLAAADRADRGAALHDLVARWTERHMERLRLTEEERGEWRQRFAEGRKKGMSQLPQSEGFSFKACPSCDGAAEKDWLK